MKLPKAWTPLKYHKAQKAAWHTKARFLGLDCGRGSGKTELAKRRLIRFLSVKKEYDDPRYFYGGPTLNQAMRTAWDHLLKLIPPEWEPEPKGTCIRTKFGSELWVVGLDKPQRIEGVQWDGGVLDESCDLKPGVFDRNVLPALSWRNGWCWRIGVPKRQGPSAKEFRTFCESARRGEIEDTESFTWPSSDILPPKLLKWAMQNMDSKDFREQFGACWETSGGQLFYSFERQYNVRPVTYKENQAIVIVSDFNIDPMCWVIGHRTDNMLELFDELHIPDCNTPKAIDVLYRRDQNHKGGFEFYGDATGDARKTAAVKSDYKHVLNHEGFKVLGRTVHYPKANPSRRDRFASCNALLCNAANQRRVFIDPRCKRLIEDLEARHCPEGSNEPSDTGDLGHITDAMGYVIHRLFPVRVELPQSSPVVIVGA